MPQKATISKQASTAPLIFKGKILKAKAATMREITADNTMVFQVEQVIKAPDMLKAIAGQNITIRFKRTPRLRSGSKLTIFCQGWIFGDSLAVDVIDYTTTTVNEAFVEKVQQSRTSAKDAVLKKRLDSAAVGVVGTVSKIEKTQNGNQTTHISEHDPNWHEATIDVDEVVKGQKNTKEVKVLFPKSDDIRWHKVNKYTEGQKGIWLLQKGQQQDTEGIHPKILAAIPSNTKVLTALHPVDFLPINELGKVKSLLNQ
jgi:hypothetical protein